MNISEHNMFWVHTFPKFSANPHGFFEKSMGWVLGRIPGASFPSWAASLMTKMVHAMHELFQDSESSESRDWILLKFLAKKREKNQQKLVSH